MRSAALPDRFASWFVQSWIAGAVIRIAAPAFALSRLRVAAVAGIPIGWRHLSGAVNVNDATDASAVAEGGGQDA